MTNAEIISALACGAQLKYDRDGWGAELVTFHGTVPSSQVNELVRDGWLESIPNGSGAKLSDLGRLSFICSTDEMGNGQLIAPVSDTRPLP